MNVKALQAPRSHRSRQATCFRLWVVIGLWLALSPGRATFAQTSPSSERLRVMIETDAPGGDADDEGSLVRFFLYLNEWDVEGIFCTRRANQSRRNEDGKTCVLRFIDAYAEAWPQLLEHDPRYPSPDSLRAITFASGEPRAREAIINAVERDAPRRIWYVNWGTNDRNRTAMLEALDHVQATRSEADYRGFADRLCFSRDADRSYHVAEHIPYLHLWVDTRNPDAWYHRFAPLTSGAGGFDIQRDVKTGHGKLGTLYTTQKEGDTPGFTYLIPTGLSPVEQPEWGSWAGRFSPRTDQHRRDGFYWSDPRDEIDGQSNRDNTLKRWAVHLQNDFKARMDWCVSDVAAANHPPVVSLNAVGGRNPVMVRARVNSTLSPSAHGSTDPDGDELTYRWFVYAEPGTYRGEVILRGADTMQAELTIPADAADKTIHVILQVTDHGAPPLTRYRRAVVTGAAAP